VAVRSKAFVCGRSFAVIAVWNPAEKFAYSSLVCAVCRIDSGIC